MDAYVLCTVSAQIERHSLLERQETVYGRAMVIFGEKCLKITVFIDKNVPKITIMHSQKF